VREGRCFVADGDRFFNRSSCEVVESAEMAAEMAHPELCGLWGHHGKHWCRLDELDAFCAITPPHPAGMPPADLTRNKVAPTKPLPPARTQELEDGALATVDAQLRALRAADFDEAFRLCSPDNQARLASAATFASICTSASFSVLVGETTDAHASAQIAPDGLKNESAAQVCGLSALYGVPMMSRLLKIVDPFCRYCLFYRALLQKRHIISRSLIIDGRQEGICRPGVWSNRLVLCIVE